MTVSSVVRPSGSLANGCARAWPTLVKVGLMRSMLVTASTRRTGAAVLETLFFAEVREPHSRSGTCLAGSS